tara:strand:- start:4309 stop:4650 length:342 start_codon:yes stop_codon:yes gene_type:complete
MLNKYRENIIVDKKLRENIFARKYIDEIVQTETLRLNEPTEEELRNDLTFVEKIFSIGDKMYKYSYEFYGSTEYWWLIAWFNNKPTDIHCKVGDVLYIPLPLDKAIVIATREK